MESPHKQFPAAGALVCLANRIALVLGLSACFEERLTTSIAKEEQVVQKDASTPFLVGPITGGSEAIRNAVTKHFAPVIYQEVNYSVADYITNVAFDGNWNGWDQWEHAGQEPMPGVIYVSLIEDANRYFIYYGTYHARDWCSGYGPFGACLAGEDEHESDLEGMSLVVDKRMATPNHPYGQIVTMETRSHYEVYSYRNCMLEGFQTYVVPHAGWQGCIAPDVSHSNTTSFSPPWRPSIYVEDRTHAVTGTRQDFFPPGFRDHGIIYFPTNLVSEVPPDPMVTHEVAYRLQWIDSTEAGINYSLWSERHNIVQGNTNSLYEHDTDTSGPHDVYYLKTFICSTHCPAFAGSRAKAPWGMGAPGIPTGAVRIGDWHNHPAWAWGHRYGAVQGLESWLAEYACTIDACRLNNSYIHNPYWSDAAWSAGSGGSGGSGPCSPSPCGRFAPSTPALTRRDTPAEVRWDFNNLHGIATVGGRGVTSQIALVADEDWGYPGHQAKVLRIVGSGTATLTLATTLEPVDFDRIVVRLRASAGASIGGFASWRNSPSTGAWTTSEESLVRTRLGLGGWEVLALPLRTDAQWQVAGRLGDISLTVRLGSLGQGWIEIDFITVSP